MYRKFSIVDLLSEIKRYKLLQFVVFCMINHAKNGQNYNNSFVKIQYSVFILFKAKFFIFLLFKHRDHLLFYALIIDFSLLSIMFMLRIFLFVYELIWVGEYSNLFLSEYSVVLLFFLCYSN